MSDTKKTKPAVKPAVKPTVKVKPKVAETTVSSDIASTESSDKLTTATPKNPDLAKTSTSEVGLETLVNKAGKKLTLLKIYKVDKGDGKLTVGDVIYEKKPEKGSAGGGCSAAAGKESSGDADSKTNNQAQQPQQYAIRYYRDQYGVSRAYRVPVSPTSYPSPYGANQAQTAQYAQYFQYPQYQQPMTGSYYQNPGMNAGAAYAPQSNYRYY